MDNNAESTTENPNNGIQIKEGNFIEFPKDCYVKSIWQLRLNTLN